MGAAVFKTLFAVRIKFGRAVIILFFSQHNITAQPRFAGKERDDRADHQLDFIAFVKRPCGADLRGFIGFEAKRGFMPFGITGGGFERCCPHNTHDALIGHIAQCRAFLKRCHFAGPSRVSG